MRASLTFINIYIRVWKLRVACQNLTKVALNILLKLPMNICQSYLLILAEVISKGLFVKLVHLVAYIPIQNKGSALELYRCKAEGKTESLWS